MMYVVTDLKPCPFCGGDAEFFVKDGWHYVECCECKMTTPLESNPDIAVEKWNRRATDEEK